MTIKQILTNKLIPYENNPRNNDGAVDAVAASIKEFGFKIPIIVDKDMVVVAGHTRLKAAKKLGLEKVPCIVADDLTDKQIKAFRLADNKTAELAEWDIEALTLELDDLDGMGFDMSEFGFDDVINGDEFGTDFELPDGDKTELVKMTVYVHKRQKELIDYAMSIVKNDIQETFGNTSEVGNCIYEVVRQWAEQRK